MAEYKVDISDFLESYNCPVIDVRSPAEYAHGHIPGALNIPLFTNEERSIVGTLYLRKGSAEAMFKGLELVGPRMKEFVRQAYEIAPTGEIGIYCWRGGLRSNSMAWLFNTAGLKSHTLDGGYKAYRRFIHICFTGPFNLTVIGGLTGSGKTEILEEIEKRGVQVLHLERLAAHKGSVFGHLGMPPQPSTEQFENDLFTALSRLNYQKPVLVEDESLSIGSVFIPRPFYRQMSSAQFIHLIVPFDRRVMQLVRTYAGWDKELLRKGIERIEKRLGSENTRRIFQLIDENEMKKAVEIVLTYYDKVYKRTMDLHVRKESNEIAVNDETTEEIADKVITVIGNQYSVIGNPKPNTEYPILKKTYS
jgi:tRNA 2-selenouridine synthase